MASILRSVLLSLFWVSPALAQDDFKSWLEKQNRKFQAYVEEYDQDFTQFLRQEWYRLNVFGGIEPDATPKPLTIPIFEPEATQKTKPRPDDDRVISLPTPDPYSPKPSDDFRIIPKRSGNVTDILFLGQRIELEIDQKMAVRIDGVEGQYYVSDFWADLSRTNYMPTLNQLQYYKDRFRLNDWAYGLLLTKVGEQIFGKERPDVTLFIWFMLLKSGYDARVGYDDTDIYLLVPSQQLLYGSSFFKFDKSNKNFLYQ